MRTCVVLAVLAVMSPNGVAQPLRPPDPPTPQQAYTNLLTVPRFAFGGVGFAGVTSDGEAAFRSIAASTNALSLFSAAFTNGNSQAKLYALCGIRQFAPGMFDSYANALRIANPQVETMVGCNILRESAREVVARISTGSYDVYFKSPNRR